jgi:transcriptional regulator with XRE-family HTH domain
MNLKKTPNLSDRLRFIRKHYNLSQAELAEKAGTTQQAIQQAEAGKARQPRYLHRLAQTLEISADWVIFGEVYAESPRLTPSKNTGFSEESSEILDSFFSMPEKDQKLILELMQSRRKK